MSTPNTTNHENVQPVSTTTDDGVVVRSHVRQVVEATGLKTEQVISPKGGLQIEVYGKDVVMYPAGSTEVYLRKGEDFYGEDFDGHTIAKKLRERMTPGLSGFIGIQGDEDGCTLFLSGGDKATTNKIITNCYVALGSPALLAAKAE